MKTSRSIFTCLALMGASALSVAAVVATVAPTPVAATTKHPSQHHPKPKPKHKAKSSIAAGAAGTADRLTFSGTLSGTANLKSSEVNCHFPPTDISINMPVNGKYYTVDIDYSLATPGTTTNLQTGGSNTSGDAVLISGQTGQTEWSSISPGTSGTITVDTSKSGSIDATLSGYPNQGEQISGSWKCPT